MSIIDDLNQVKFDLSAIDSAYGIHDRGQMYLRTYALTNSQSSVIEGNIQTLCGY